MSDRRVAVVGATGAVGRTMIGVLSERDFPLADLRLLASARSAGSTVATRWGEIKVEDLEDADPSGIDIALFSAGADRSRAFAPAFVKAGAVVVDNSSAFRRDPNVPLVVAGVNDHAIGDHRGIVSNPNCTTMALMVAIGPLHRAAGLERMVATSYQSVSGSGQRGIDELSRQVDLLGRDRDALVGGGWADPGGDLYARPIGWNVLPWAGSETEQRYTDEEWKLVNESRKILEVPDLEVEPTCVRVPVMVGHGIAATLWFHRSLDVFEALELLGEAPGAELWVDRVPTPLDCAGRDDVLIGRVRQTLGRPGGINLWAVGDNLRKGAAVNAVQIAERLS
jgi:aspartate-semialdehyde dehydrogenase